MPATSGSVSKVLENGETLISNVPAFQTLVGAPGDATTAAASIYIPALEPADADLAATWQALRPYCLLMHDIPVDFKRQRVSETGYEDSGSFLALFSTEVPADTSIADAETTINNLIGDLMDGIATLVAGGGYINIRSMETVMGPVRADSDQVATEGDFHDFALKLGWGT